MPLSRAKVIKNNKLTHDVFEIDFETQDVFKYTEGQYITIKANSDEGPAFRAYSICTSYNKNRVLSLCVKAIPNGKGSNYLKNLSKHDTIEFMGPFGDFTTRKTKNKKMIFIATGTGIAPFKAMIEKELKKDKNKKIDLIFGVRYGKDIFYKEFFEKLAQEHENFKFTLTLTRPPAHWQGNSGRVTRFVEKIDDTDVQQNDFYICGLTAMIESVNKILLKKGLPKEQIFFEKYD